MKKKFILILALLAATTFVKADPFGSIVPLTGDVKTQPQEGEHPRTPAPTPVFYLDDHTLTASSYTLGSTIELKDEDDNVVFSTYVYMEGEIELPADLEGTYTIEVTRGSMVFVGEIEL